MNREEEPTTADLLHVISRLDEKVDRVLVQTTKTNGRVDKLEIKDIEREKREAVADALATASGSVFLTKKQLYGMGVAAGLLFTAAQILIGLLK